MAKATCSVIQHERSMLPIINQTIHTGCNNIANWAVESEDLIPKRTTIIDGMLLERLISYLEGVSLCTDIWSKKGITSS